MNTNLSLLLFASLSFLDSFFPSGLLLRKLFFSTTLHGLALKFQGTWMVPSSDPFLRKQTSAKNSNRILMFRIYFFVKLFRISLALNAEKNLLQHLFFAKHTFWSSIWSSTVEVPFIFIDLCRRFSIVDAPSSGPENVPKPRLPPYRSPLFCCFEYLQRHNVGQMLWKSCPVHCKPD